MPVEVTEFALSSTGVLPDFESAKALFTADVPIILCNPISTPVATTITSPTLPLTRENAILAVLSPSPAHPATAAHSSQVDSLASQKSLRIVFVDPVRALHGLEMLDSGVASPMAVQRYQDDFSGSNVSSITHTVKEILTHSQGDPSSVPSSTRVVAVHTQTGRALISEALATSGAVLHKAGLEADAVLTATSALRDQMEEAKAKVHLEVFGVEGKDGDEIAKAVAQAKKSVQPTLDALQWYKLFWRVDDIREVVTAAVDRAWCRDLERKVSSVSFARSGVIKTERTFHTACVPCGTSSSPSDYPHGKRELALSFIPACIRLPLPRSPQHPRAYSIGTFISHLSNRAHRSPACPPESARLPHRAPPCIGPARCRWHEWERSGRFRNRLGRVGDRVATVRWSGRHRHEHRDCAWGRDVECGGGFAVGRRPLGEGEKAVVEELGSDWSGS